MVRAGVPAAVLALLAAAAAGLTQAAASDDAADCASVTAASQQRRTQVTGSGLRIAVIGDSWSQGWRLDEPSSSWPSRLPGEVVVDGFAGSGFAAAASPCRGVAFAQRARHALATEPGLVVVQGGLNDFDVPEAGLRTGVRRLLAELRGHRVVVVGPAHAPARAEAAVRVDAVLAEEARAAGVAYVRTVAWSLEYLPDDLHLTAEGHRAFGDAVATALVGLG